MTDWQFCNTKPKKVDTDALNDATHCEKAGNLLFVRIPQIFLNNRSCFAAITYQIKHYFDISNCKFTCRYLIPAIWRGSPCRRSSNDANTDWVHCLSPRCRVKWQTVLPAIWSQRWCDFGCATTTVATDANVVTMSPDVASLAGLLTYCFTAGVLWILKFKYPRGRRFCWGDRGACVLCLDENLNYFSLAIGTDAAGSLCTRIITGWAPHFLTPDITVSGCEGLGTHTQIPDKATSLFWDWTPGRWRGNRMTYH